MRHFQIILTERIVRFWRYLEVLGDSLVLTESTDFFTIAHLFLAQNETSPISFEQASRTDTFRADFLYFYGSILMLKMQ